MPRPAMEADEILKQLEIFSRPFPRAAVEAAADRREEIAPRLVRILEETVENASQRAHQQPPYMAHLYAMYLLAQFRDRRAYAPLIALAKLPDDLLDLLFGEVLTDGFPQALASVWDGDLRPIQSLIEDEAAYEYSRMAGLSAIVALVSAGEVTRDTAVAYFAELFDGRLRGPETLFGELVSCACDLHPGELYPRIVRAFEQELVDEIMIDMDDVRAARRQSPEAALATTRREPNNKLITDTVAAMEWWASFREPAELDDDEPLPDWPELDDDWDRMPIRRAQPKVGRNEPCPCGSGKKFKKCCGR